MPPGRWVMLSYRLPREPSTPRIALWRRLRRLGALQVIDGLAALPLDSRTREQFEWLASEVEDAGGEASVWLSEPATRAQERTLAARMQETVAAEYRDIRAAAQAAIPAAADEQRRTLRRLRRELDRIRRRDYFPPPDRAAAKSAVDELAGAAQPAVAPLEESPA